MTWLQNQMRFPAVSRTTVTEEKLLLWLATTQIGRKAKIAKIKAFDKDGNRVMATVGMKTHENSVSAVCKIWQYQVNNKVS